MVDETTDTGAGSLWRHLKRDRWPVGPRSLAAVAVAGLFLGSAIAPTFADAIPKGSSVKQEQEATKKAAKASKDAAKKADKAAHGPKAQQAESNGGCTEDAFVSQVIPTAGTAVGPGSTIGVTYDDETNLNTETIEFTLNGDPVPYTLDPPAGGKYVHITYQLPTDLTDGTYVASVYAEDLDQHTPGGDCGYNEWTFSVGSGTNTTPGGTTGGGTTGGGTTGSGNNGNGNGGGNTNH
jgi:hypothetical protein